MTYTIQEFNQQSNYFQKKLNEDFQQLFSEGKPKEEIKQLHAVLQDAPLLPEDVRLLMEKDNLFHYLATIGTASSAEELIVLLSNRSVELYQLQLNFVNRILTDLSTMNIAEHYLQDDIFAVLIDHSHFCKRELERALQMDENLLNLVATRFNARYYPSLTILDIAHNAFSRT